MTDASFLDTFSKSSRLGFIGRWEEVWRDVLDGRDDVDAAPLAPPPPPPGRSRTIAHIDLDCFFAAVAVRDRPELRGRPVAVTWARSSGGESSGAEISSCTYEARAFGVRAGMRLRDAVRVCPDLASVPYDFEKIAEAAVAAHGKVLDETPHVVAKSIDECYADVTAAVCAASADDAEGAGIVAARIRAGILAARRAESQEFFTNLVPPSNRPSFPAVFSDRPVSKAPRSSPTPGERVFKNSFRNARG